MHARHQGEAMSRPLNASVLALVLACAIPLAHAQSKSTVDPKMLTRGKYLVQTSGCNDCHTAGYAQSGGNVPESEWLKGDMVGWRGAWGTTYPSNLRLVIG